MYLKFKCEKKNLWKKYFAWKPVMVMEVNYYYWVWLGFVDRRYDEIIGKWKYKFRGER